MRSAAQPISVVPERSTDPLEHVDYRLAETPEDKDRIYRLRYRAYLREGAILPSESSGSPTVMTTCPTTSPSAFTFTASFTARSGSACCPRNGGGLPRPKCSEDLIHPELDRGKIIIDPTRFVADPEKAKRFPELPYVTVRLGYIACGHFSADIGLANVRPEHRAFYREGILAGAVGRTETVSRPDQAGRADGRQIFGDSGAGVPAFPLYAFQRLRTADAVRAREGRAFLACVGGGVARPRSCRRPDRPDPAQLQSSASPDRIRRRLFVHPGLSRGRVPDPGVRLSRLLPKDRPEKPAIKGRAPASPSPSRHIYKSLTITVAFRRLPAFDRVWQHPIKVDGTFA